MTGKVIEESLLPIPSKQKDLSYSKFTLSWASDLIALYSFMMGAGAIAAGLNILQAFVAMIIGLAVDVVLLVLNGLPGFKLGIPMVIQMRPCFGNKSAKITGIIRALPAIAWFGFNSFLGALGLNLFSIVLFGYNNVWVWFFVFHILQVILSALGVKKMLNFTSYSAVALFVIILAMVAHIRTVFGFNLTSEMMSKGSWGMPFWLTVTAFISVGIAVVVNSSDYIRYLKNDSMKKYVWSYALGLVPTMTIMAGLGMVVVSVSGVWSPIDLFVKYVPSIWLIAIAMGFIILGQFSTNMFANIIPANFVWGEIFKMPWWFASVFTGGLGLIIIPWYLTTAAGFFNFMNIYGALLGPIAGIMIVDYVIIRKGKYNMEALYSGTQYDYWKGVNPAGIIALIIGSVAGICYINLSSITGTIVGALSYYFLYKYWIIKKYPQVELSDSYVISEVLGSNPKNTEEGE